MEYSKMAVPWEDLATRGFVVIPSFLSPDELRVSREDYSAIGIDANLTYRIKSTQLASLPQFHSKFVAVAEAAGCSGVRADIVLGGVYFSTKLGVDFGWHQDHESYYEFQNHLNYLNFYIPIKKPVKEKSNVSLIPFDELSRRLPDLFARVRGKGAARFRIKNGQEVMLDDNRGAADALSLTLNELSVTPELAEGDLLLFRGDVIHKTQDTDTDRISVSIRMVDSNGPLSLRQLTSLCWVKYRIMAQNHIRYQLQLECFAAARKKELTIGEYLSFVRGKVPQERNRPAAVLKFTKTLLCGWIAARFPGRKQLRP